MNTKSFLIKDTTKEERIALIKEWIPDDVCAGFSCFCCSDNCGISLWDMYDAYIKGEKEISQINMEFRASYYTEGELEEKAPGCGQGYTRR